MTSLRDEILKLTARGLGPKEIAEKLREQGVKTKNGRHVEPSYISHIRTMNKRSKMLTLEVPEESPSEESPSLVAVIVTSSTNLSKVLKEVFG